MRSHRGPDYISPYHARCVPQQRGVIEMSNTQRSATTSSTISSSVSSVSSASTTSSTTSSATLVATPSQAGVEKQISLPPVEQKPVVPDQNMAAITAILNPLTAHKDEKKVLIFSSLANHTLGLEQRVLGAAFRQPRGYEKSTKSPELQFPSSLVSIVLDDTVQVYGTTKDDKAIALLSPIYQPIPDVNASNGLLSSNGGTLAGCSNGSDEGWLYYQYLDAKNNRNVIKEQVLSDIQQSASTTNASQIMVESSLAAVYDGKRRWLVYQKSDRLIAIRNIRKGTEDIVGTYRDQPKVKTQLAVSYTPGQKGEYGRIYVYFVANDQSLYRAWSEVGDRLNFEGEGAPQEVDPNSGTIVDFSQISVVPDPAKRRNVIYAMKGSNSATQIVSTIFDPWDRVYEAPRPRYQPATSNEPQLGVPSMPGLPAIPAIQGVGNGFADPQMMKEFFLLYASQYMSKMEDKNGVVPTKAV